MQRFVEKVGKKLLFLNNSFLTGYRVSKIEKPRCYIVPMPANYAKTFLNMTKETDTRPPFLSALCILTFFGSSIGFVGYFLASLFFEKSSELIIKYSSWHTTDAISPVYFTVLMALFAFSLAGAIRIWKFYRDGIFIYTLSQLAILFLPLIWVGSYSFSVVNAIVTSVFVVGYFFHWRWVK